MKRAETDNKVRQKRFPPHLSGRKVQWKREEKNYGYTLPTGKRWSNNGKVGR